MTGNLRADIEALVDEAREFHPRRMGHDRQERLVRGLVDVVVALRASLATALAAHPAEESVTVTADQVREALYGSGLIPPFGSAETVMTGVAALLAALGVTVTGEEADRG